MLERRTGRKRAEKRETKIERTQTPEKGKWRQRHREETAKKKGR